MDIYDQIRVDLRARNVAGMTYKRFEVELGVCGSYVQRIVSGLSDPQKMTLETFFKLFPSAQIFLNNSAQSAPVSGDSLRHERELLELERAELAAQRRELEEARKNIELEKEIFELKKNAAALPRAHHAAEPAAPYRFAPVPESTSSPSK